MTNKLKLLPLLALLCLLTPQARAQKSLPAYILTATNDTIHGAVHKQNLSSTLQTVSFKPANETDFRTYSPAAINRLVLERGLYYEPVTATMQEGQKVFMRLLVDGPVKLYHSDNLSDASEYYVKKPGEQLVQLRKNSLQGTMAFLLSDCGQASLYKYTSEKLATAIDAYNKCKYPQEASAVLLKQAHLTYLAGVRAGAHLSSFSYTGVAYGEDIPRKPQQTGPSITGGVFLNISQASSRFSLQPELLLRQFKGTEHITGTGAQLLPYTYESTLDVVALQLPLLLQYTQPLTSQWNAYLLAGPSASYLLKADFSNSIVYEDKHQKASRERTEQLDRIGTGATAGLGLKRAINAKSSFFVDLRYSFDRVKSAYSNETGSSRTRNLNFSGASLTLGLAL